MLSVTQMNKTQADDFLTQYFQDNIKILELSKDDEDGIYFLDIESGKRGNKIISSWQFRPGMGLCFGSHIVPGTIKRFDVYDHTQSLLDKANKVAEEYVKKWENISPIRPNNSSEEEIQETPTKVEITKEDGFPKASSIRIGNIIAALFCLVGAVSFGIGAIGLKLTLGVLVIVCLMRVAEIAFRNAYPEDEK